MGVFDVPSGELIKEIANDMETKFKVKAPEFTLYVKTGSSRERAPSQSNWYYMRLASILYRTYKEGSLGVGSLRTYYGGKKNRGVQKNKFKKAGGKIIRIALQQLEELGFVKKAGKGRMISPKGQSYLTQKSTEIKKTLTEKNRVPTIFPKEPFKTVVKPKSAEQTEKTTPTSVEKTNKKPIIKKPKKQSKKEDSKKTKKA